MCDLLSRLVVPYGSYATNGVSSPWPMSDRVAVERKDFEDFLADNQKLLDHSQALMSKIDQLENENKQLRDELQATKTRLGAIESNIANNMRQGNESLRKARETMSQLAKEAEKRNST